MKVLKFDMGRVRVSSRSRGGGGGKSGIQGRWRGAVGRISQSYRPFTAVSATATGHVSDSPPASGTTNTVMSSPEPSLSLGSLQPRSFSTPRDLISTS